MCVCRVCVCVCVLRVCVFVGSCLATKIFVDVLSAMGRDRGVGHHILD